MFSGFSTSGVHFLSFVKSLLFLRKYPMYVCMKISHANLSWLILPRRSGTCIDFQFSSANLHFFFAASEYCSLQWKSSVDARIPGAELLLVVLRYELLDVSQLVVEILTATLLLVVVGIGLKKSGGGGGKTTTDKQKRS